GSTLRYGSSFLSLTLNPRACSSAPSAAAERPLPRDETTPPVIKINRVMELQCIAPETGVTWLKKREIGRRSTGLGRAGLRRLRRRGRRRRRGGGRGRRW